MALVELFLRWKNFPCFFASVFSFHLSHFLLISLHPCRLSSALPLHSFLGFSFLSFTGVTLSFIPVSFTPLLPPYFPPYLHPSFDGLLSLLPSSSADTFIPGCISSRRASPKRYGKRYRKLREVYISAGFVFDMFTTLLLRQSSGLQWCVTVLLNVMHCLCLNSVFLIGF